MLYAAIGLGSDMGLLLIILDSDYILKQASKLESNVYFNQDERVDQKYKSRIRTLFLNLKSKSNPSLRNSVLSGRLSIEKLSNMTTEVYFIINNNNYHII